MKFTYNWLKDFVKIGVSPEELAEKLTMAGMEVVSLEEKGGDYIFELEVTPNRPDCLSIAGIARELAALYPGKVKLPKGILSRPKQRLSPFSLAIEIEDGEGCSLYTAKIIKGVKVCESPLWLKKRIESVGIRSVNNVVDLTNYILLECGEPLHAFDLDKIANSLSRSPDVSLSIVVRRAKEGEKITTIDGIDRILNKEILVIASGRNESASQRVSESAPIAIAGVMGGRDTEVDTKTRNILLEAAIFNPLVIRRARRVLALSTESSYRFERGIDPLVVEEASMRCCRLIEDFTGGKLVSAAKKGQPKAAVRTIVLNTDYVNKIIGINIKATEIKSILSNLGFKIGSSNKDKIDIQVPSYRSDVSLEEDLIEEIARIYGYEKIPKTLPAINSLDPVAIGKKDIMPIIRNTLLGLGLNEVKTYSLVDRTLLQGFHLQGNLTEVLNPLSKEQELLRPTIIPSLVRCVGANLNKKQEHVNIFEISSVFLGSDKTIPKEELKLGIALCGTKSHLFSQGISKEEMGFLHLKGIVEALLGELGIKKFSFVVSGRPDRVDINTDACSLGFIERLSSHTKERFDIKYKDVFVAELSLEKIMPRVNLERRFEVLSKYPSISRDISFVIPGQIPLGEILDVMKEKGEPLLYEIKLVDFYKGKQIPADCRGLTLSCIYHSEERTLTESEIIPLHESISSILIERFQAKIR